MAPFILYRHHCDDELKFWPNYFLIKTKVLLNWLNLDASIPFPGSITIPWVTNEIITRPLSKTYTDRNQANIGIGGMTYGPNWWLNQANISQFQIAFVGYNHAVNISRLFKLKCMQIIIRTKHSLSLQSTIYFNVLITFNVKLVNNYAVIYN